jgi:RNA polymerase sigma-70 factor (sigma-E family)
LGHRLELADFCREQYRPMVRMLSLYTGSVHVGQELAQDALARAWLNWSKVKRLDDPVAWTRRVALNLANSYFRRLAAEKRAKKKLASMPTEDRAPSSPIDDRDLLRQAIAGLPERQRTALILRYFLDMPVLEVAEWMGVPEGTVKSLAKRAVDRLRKDAALREAKGVWSVT